MLAISFGHRVRLMAFSEEGVRVDVGTFDLTLANSVASSSCHVEELFFIGTQLVALSPAGKIGVWNSMSQHWQSQETAPITAHDTAGSFLLLGELLIA